MMIGQGSAKIGEWVQTLSLIHRVKINSQWYCCWTKILFPPQNTIETQSNHKIQLKSISWLLYLALRPPSKPPWRNYKPKPPQTKKKRAKFLNFGTPNGRLDSGWIFHGKLTAGTQWWRFGRWFSIANGWFLGSSRSFSWVVSSSASLSTLVTTFCLMLCDFRQK